jgi:hypothetical protein
MKTCEKQRELVAEALGARLRKEVPPPAEQPGDAPRLDVHAAHS